jgi:hypothetical protein
MKAAIIGIRTLADLSVSVKDHQQTMGYDFVNLTCAFLSHAGFGFTSRHHDRRRFRRCAVERKHGRIKGRREPGGLMNL